MNRPPLLRLVALVAGLCWSASARPQESAGPFFVPDAALLKQVESLARSGATAAAPRVPGNLRVEVTLGHLDPRLHLAACSQVEAFLPAGVPAWGATRVGLRCAQGPKRWNVSMPVTVSLFTQATVVRDALPAGTVIEAAQLEQAEVDIAAGPGMSILDPAEVLGRTIAHTVPAGATLHQSDLKPRQYFAAGETVRVVATGPGWQVVTEGEAISAGIEGQPARVRTEGGRILNARPRGEREVEVSL